MDFPVNPLGIGKESPSVILCNRCGKRISVRGIHPETMERGEYQVSYFRCIHCGQEYQITTTDALQRQYIEWRRRFGAKIRFAYGQRFRQKTVDQWHREYDNLDKTMNRRAAWLYGIGEEILSGKEILTTRNGDGGYDAGQGGSDGTADGQGGAESLSGN